MGRTEHTAVVDRFENDQAVLLVEDDGAVVDELVVTKGLLPDAARQQDAVLRIAYVDDAVVQLRYDAEETEARTASAQSRFDRLSQRPPSSDDTVE
ncbi:DUF3006 domain-containing protein [Halomicroarcula sp. GCM10025324]|uniref:DUF3006 domain-containing protein n=1 Tax=Haloarcula TaxID=2237 RepID=UPI0023E8360C|nr:DUF3006 domain-containing protein [Halomicroarcula sp. ZS-22-S1]